MPTRFDWRIEDRPDVQTIAGDSQPPEENPDSGAWFAACAQTDRLNTTHMTTNISKKVFGCMGTGYRFGQGPRRLCGDRVMTCIDYRPKMNGEV